MPKRVKPTATCKLSEKEKSFAREYIIDLNGKQAAIRAGYSPRSATVTASRLLTRANVTAEIQRNMDRRGRRVEITADMVLQEIAKLAFSDLRDFFDWNGQTVTLKPSDQLTEAQSRAVAEIAQVTTKEGGSVKIKLYDKVRALELLGKHLKLFNEHLEITGKDGGPVKIENMSDEELLVIAAKATIKK